MTQKKSCFDYPQPGEGQNICIIEPEDDKSAKLAEFMDEYMKEHGQPRLRMYGRKKPEREYWPAAYSGHIETEHTYRICDPNEGGDECILTKPYVRRVQAEDQMVRFVDRQGPSELPRVCGTFDFEEEEAKREDSPPITKPKSTRTQVLQPESPGRSRSRSLK